MFEYDTLRLIWWVLIGVLLIGFMITDGFDMGVGALLPLIGKTNSERRVMINSIAPHWDGNQVWLITAGGALFAAWPLVYATSFSSLYVAMYLALISLWLRPLALEYRAKIDKDQWRKVCDLAISFSGFFPPILFGVAFGNLMQGLPFSLNSLLMVEYHGSFVDLVNPFALLCGFIGLLMALLQGCAWLMMKTTDALYNKTRLVAQASAILVASLMVLGGLTISHIDGYLIASELNHSAVSNPLNKQAIVETGAWLANFEIYPWMWFAPIGSVIIPLLALISARLKWDAIAFISSSLTNACIILTAGFSMFPFIIPSSVNPSHSLTLWDSTSSELTLNIMTGVAFVMVPIILCYTAFSYRTMFGRLDNEYVERNGNSLY
ncbi:cytochrome d ubiquinol oxidase subunit II [Vibrio lentus]|uniref:Cytochrome d ubiquinol oxidase subunit II n=1 Tax=Vibrio lentus TaxID=136468 RepID=A0AB36XV78_9VIBR|nr:cytochrome d ubiquinol oxidase subunit II [Vibrio lentus]MCC4838595.1 cytochrome d ubiquinol oxidase subunit II [Vibrio lentus]PMI16891.1 cytochrome d ubiquinol oxidase subunit II [Vibrio lentus]PMK36583.1 cytochrome d ubiquinol oxidase subunit II [Vibrio lentus]PMK50432.1 cytochrome d ubiquinol oxidase subunit II [Vibrio lentus]PML27864.1 cytochrome d ubiquinol oxidase subunit II [Vibrio lentus]